MKFDSITLPLQVASQMLQQDPRDQTLFDLLGKLSKQSQNELAPLIVQAAQLPDENLAARTVGRLLAIRPEWANAQVGDGEDGITALDIAVRVGRLAMVDTLLDLGADARNGTGQKGSTVLEVAASVGTGNARVMDAITTAILEKGQYRQADKSFALAVAASSGNLGSTQALLRAGAGFSAELSSWGGRMGTALAVAASHPEYDGSSEKIVEAMLANRKSRKALNDGWDNEGFGAPAHCAAYTGNENILRRLIEAGALVNPPDGMEDEYPRTPLMAAAFGLKDGSIKMLVAAGADATLVDVNGQNAMHHLARCDSETEEEVELLHLQQAFNHLLWAGCSPLELDDDGHSPGQVARNCGREKFANWVELGTATPKVSKKRSRLSA